MGQIIKDKLMSSVPFWVCLTTSIVLFISGFVVPPTGVLDPSVLKAGGELLGFAALGVGADAIRYGYDVKINHGETTVTIGNTDEDKKEE